MITLHDLELGTIETTCTISNIEYDVKVEISQDYLSYEDIMGDCEGEILCEPKTLFDLPIDGYRNTYYFHMDMDELITLNGGDVEKAKEWFKSSYLRAQDWVQDDVTSVHINVSIDAFGKEFENSCGGYLLYYSNTGRGYEANKYVADAANELITETIYDIERYIKTEWQPELFGDL